MVWPKVAPRRIKFIPAALVGIVVATLFANWAGMQIQRLVVPDNMFSETTLPTTATWFQLLLDPIVLTGAMVIGLVASAETLLCATAVDQMHTGPRTDYDRELTAQGVGNVLCGLIGALPMTGVIVRSSANVNSGAKTRLSAILHGFWLLLFVALGASLLAYIPRAALGALLVYIGIKLVNIRAIRELWATSRSEVAIYAITVLVIVVEDLLVGVVVGIVLSAVKLLYRFSHLDIRMAPDGAAPEGTASEGTVSGGRTINMELEGAATFLRLPQLARKLDEVPSGAELHVDLRRLGYIDHACLELLMGWADQHRRTGGALVLDWDQLHAQFHAHRHRREASDGTAQVRMVAETREVNRRSDVDPGSTLESRAQSHVRDGASSRQSG